MADRTHGGPDPRALAALGIDPAAVLDFSVNVNPHGPAPSMRQAVLAAPIDRYPDATAWHARRALAQALGEDVDRLAIGNGAAELLWTLARALVPPGAAALLVEPTFSELRAAVLAGDGRAVEWRARSDDGFRVDGPAVALAARAAQARLVYLCNPNNPTGRVLPIAEVAALAVAMGDTPLVLDEAFLSLSTHHADRDVRLPANVVRVRSLTKEHALPGLRVGYLIAPAPLVARLERLRPAWTTSAGCQAAVGVAVTLDAFVAESRDRLLADAAALAVSLHGLGLRPVASDTCYVLVPVGDAAAVRTRLLVGHGILVRDCASFGLPDHIRLAARPAPDRARLQEALADVLGPNR